MRLLHFVRNDNDDSKGQMFALSRCAGLANSGKIKTKNFDVCVFIDVLITFEK